MVELENENLGRYISVYVSLPSNPGEKPDSNKENNNVSNGDKPRRGSNASRDRSDSRDNQRSRSKDKGAAAAAGKNKRSSSKDSKAASRESTASNGREIDKER